MTVEWTWDDDENGGEPEDLGVIVGLVSRDGFDIGDEIIVTDDYRNGMYEFFEGNKGTVVGFTEAENGIMGNNPPLVMAKWEDWDPGPIDPNHIEVV